MVSAVEVSHISVQDQVNDRVYQAASVVRHYHSDRLERAEACALLKYQPTFAGQDVLDVGVGTGRTAIYLAPLARRYEGIDYSQHMVDRARASLPGLSIQHRDMRDLKGYGAGSFDFVLGSNNVLDAVSHDDRLRTLRELRRVLRPGGVLMFSAHNRCWEHALSGPRLKWSRNPLTLARNLGQLALQRFNRGRLRKLHRQEMHYALLSDEGHDFACLHYYIDRQAQELQLRALGFRVLEVFSAWGASLGVDDFGEASPWLMYVATAIV
jgi:SAM-dependent methyltransferase